MLQLQETELVEPVLIGVTEPITPTLGSPYRLCTRQSGADQRGTSSLRVLLYSRVNSYMCFIGFDNSSSPSGTECSHNDFHYPQIELVRLADSAHAVLVRYRCIPRRPRVVSPFASLRGWWWRILRLNDCIRLRPRGPRRRQHWPVAH